MTLFKSNMQATAKPPRLLRCSGGWPRGRCGTAFYRLPGQNHQHRDTFVKKPTKENFYHGILLGILGYKNEWYVQSNKEAGGGYSDILIRIDSESTGIIIEVKYAEKASLIPSARRP